MGRGLGRRRGEHHVFPSDIGGGAGAAELEHSVERFEREGDESEESTSVHADGEVEVFIGEVERTIAGEGEGLGGGLEVVGVGDAFVDGIVDGSAFGVFDAGAFVVEDGIDEAGERAEERDREEFGVFDGEDARALDGIDLAIGHGEVDLTSEFAIRFIFMGVVIGDLAE